MELTKDELTFIHDILAQQQIPAGHQDFELFSQMMISILPKLRGKIQSCDSVGNETDFVTKT